MSSLAIACLLYGLSCIPWIFSMITYSRDVQFGLFLIDILLTCSAFFYLFQAVGFWWSLVAFVANVALGYILRGFDLEGYDQILN